MRAWIDWYDSNHTIYANAHHRDVHFRNIADDIAGYVPNSGARVLDYGCGEALYADRTAAVCGKLVLAEGAPGVRARISARFAGHAKIEVVSTDDVPAMADGSFDLAVMHSVAQYLTGEELDGILATLRRLLKPEGVLVLGDILAPNIPAAIDALALLRLGFEAGFLFDAFAILVRTVFSRYWRLRSSLGLTRYDEAAIAAKLRKAGFSATRAARNIGHNQWRMTFICRPI